MTNLEIVEKSNQYKTQYNNNKKNVSRNQQTINLLNQLKSYFAQRHNKTNSQKKILLRLSIILSPIAISFFSVSIPVAITLLAVAFVSITRFQFLNFVDKKFNRCLEVLEMHINSLNDKQISYLQQQEFIMSNIISLENEIPDEIIKPLTKLTFETQEQTSDNELSL